MLTEEDYIDLEQRLFALVNDMGLNFAKYSTLITNSVELNDADEDYHVRYTEAQSVLDNIADWRRNLTQPTSAATTNMTSTSVPTPVSVAPSVSVATPRVQTSTTKTPSIDGAKAPSLTADGSSRVQTKIPYSAPSTSVQVSTYPNTLPIFTSAPRNVKFSLPAFVASTTGAKPKGCSQMTRPTGVTTVTSSTATRPSVFPNVQFQPFVPQTKTVPVVENIGSDRGTDFQHQIQLLPMPLQIKLPACHHILLNFGILQLNMQVELQVRTITHLQAVQTSVKKITELVNNDLFSSQNVTPSMLRQKPNSGRRSEHRLTLQSAVAECLMLRNF
jgi:hypothetical protein